MVFIGSHITFIRLVLNCIAWITDGIYTESRFVLPRLVSNEILRITDGIYSKGSLQTNNYHKNY